MAILFEEPDRAEFALKIQQGRPRLLSVATLLEATMVVEGRGGPSAGAHLDSFLRSADVEFVDVTPEQAEIARIAWRRFGKGKPPRTPELRRLLLLRPRQDYRRTPPLQRRRLLTNGYPTRLTSQRHSHPRHQLISKQLQTIHPRILVIPVVTHHHPTSQTSPSPPSSPESAQAHSPDHQQ